MKKLNVVFLCLLIITALCACGESAPAESSAPDVSVPAASAPDVSSPGVSAPESGAEIVIRRLHPIGGESIKYVRGAAADEIVALITSSAPTGERAPALNGIGSVDERDFMNFYALKIESWTSWVEFGGKTYRFDPGFQTCAEVGTLLGEGELLDIPEELPGLLSQAYSYWPYDTYRLTAGDGTVPGAAEHLYTAESKVKVTVVSAGIKDKSAGVYDRSGVLTFTAAAETDMTVLCTLTCDQSDDNLGSESEVSVELKAGVPQEVTMEFAPYGRGFVPELVIDNTRVIVIITE